MFIHGPLESEQPTPDERRTSSEALQWSDGAGDVSWMGGEMSAAHGEETSPQALRLAQPGRQVSNCEAGEIGFTERICLRRRNQILLLFGMRWCCRRAPNPHGLDAGGFSYPLRLPPPLANRKCIHSIAGQIERLTLSMPQSYSRRYLGVHRQSFHRANGAALVRKGFSFRLNFLSEMKMVRVVGLEPTRPRDTRF